MRNSLLCVLALSFASFASVTHAAECVIEMKSSTGSLIQQFKAAECRDALRECAKAIRSQAGAICTELKAPAPQPQQPAPQPQQPSQPGPGQQWPGQPQQPSQPGPGQQWPGQPQQPGQPGPGQQWPGQQPRPQPPIPQQPQVQIPREVQHLSFTAQAQQAVFQNCELRQSSAWDHELLVDQVFFGRFDLNRDRLDLDRVISSLVARGDCRYKRSDILSLQLDPMLIQNSMDFGLRQCRLAEEIRGGMGRTGQFRLDVQYPSSSRVFSLPAQESELRVELALRIINGHCQQRSAYEVSLLRDPMLISNFMNRGVLFCHLRAVGAQHNLYIRGKLSGQFNLRRDEGLMRETFVNLIIQGTCVPKR